MNKRAGSIGILGIVAVIVAAIVLAVTAPKFPVADTPAVPDDAAVPPESAMTDASALTPFYRIGRTVEGVPGTMLREQAVEDAPSDVEMSRIMYVSEDVNGNRIPVSGLYVTPGGEEPQGGWPLVAYSHGTTGSTRICGISQTPLQQNTPGYYAWSLQIKPLVEQGWAVVATDYEDMGAPGTPMYLIGKTQGQNVLDSVRAIQRTKTNVNPTKTAVWGHSEGGLGAYATGQIAPTYAPEVPIDGIVSVAPGIVPALPFALNAIVKDPEPSGQTSFVMQIVRSWVAQFPDQLDEDALTTELGRTVGFDAIESSCGSSIKAALDQPMGAYISEPLPNSIYPLLVENTVPETDLTIPSLLIQGMKDEAILPTANIAYFNLLCNAGVPAELAVWKNDSHNGVVISARETMDDWVADRFAGKPAGNDCPNQ